MNIREALRRVPPEQRTFAGVCIRPIADDEDLWFAAVECELAPGQEEFVNPAGFSIGRAYLAPEKNVPCIICRADGTRIGYLVFRLWAAGGAFSWSYYLDRRAQGQGLGTAAARLAVQILRAADPAMPIRLAVDERNRRAQAVYRRIGFRRLPERDGDELVFSI